jgi:ribonuclease HI
VRLSDSDRANALIIYTDGSSRPRPRRGGYAYVLLSEDESGEELLHEYSAPGFLGATNNEAANALQAIGDGEANRSLVHGPIP